MKKEKTTKKEQPRTTIGKADMLRVLEECMGIVTIAAQKVGIDRRTHTNWMNEDDDYRAAVEELQQPALDFAEGALHKKIKEGDTTAIIFYLKTKGKSRGYIERIQTQEVKNEPFVMELTDTNTSAT